MATTAEKDIIRILKEIGKSSCTTAKALVPEETGSSVGVDNRHAEVIDTGTNTFTGLSNYSYSIISGSATVTINGVTLTGLPAGFDARQGESTSNDLLNDITITGETVGTRVIIYYEL